MFSLEVKRRKEKKEKESSLQEIGVTWAQLCWGGKSSQVCWSADGTPVITRATPQTKLTPGNGIDRLMCWGNDGVDNGDGENDGEVDDVGAVDGHFESDSVKVGESDGVVAGNGENDGVKPGDGEKHGVLHGVLWWWSSWKW